MAEKTSILLQAASALEALETCEGPGVIDRNALVTVAFERSRVPIVITDCRKADNPIVLANPAFLHLTGYDEGEVIGRNCRFLQGEATSKTAIAEIRAAIAVHKALTVELVNYRKDGSAFRNQLTISPIFDNRGGLIYFFGSQRDVTRVRRIHELEHAQTVLLREVDHRAMNALALVQAIVGLSRKDTAEAYAAAVRGRVQALARAHKILAESSWGAAPLAELICGEVGSYGGGRFSLEGPDVAIAPQLVQPIVLLLHELSVNASVHGAFGASEGGVKVSWRRGQEPDDIALRWEEHGGPPPAEVRASGFGTTILKALVERQLQGSWTAEWPATGLVLHLRFRNAEP